MKAHWLFLRAVNLKRFIAQFQRLGLGEIITPESIEDMSFVNLDGSTEALYITRAKSKVRWLPKFEEGEPLSFKDFSGVSHTVKSLYGRNGVYVEPQTENGAAAVIPLENGSSLILWMPRNGWKLRLQICSNLSL